MERSVLGTVGRKFNGYKLMMARSRPDVPHVRVDNQVEIKNSGLRDLQHGCSLIFAILKK